MKTVAQWAEQLPELIRIELIEEAEVGRKPLEKTNTLHNCIDWSLVFDKTTLKAKFWWGVYDNAIYDPASADYIDETIPYTKEEVEAMILEFADPNDEVCKVMLANVFDNQIKDIEQNLEDNFKPLHETKTTTMDGFYSKIKLEQENSALKSTIEGLRAIDKTQKIILQEKEEAITGLASENAQLISETQRLNHLVETQKVEIENYKNERVDLVFHLANAKLEIGELKDKICGLSDDLINVENNNHELLEQIKPTPQPKTSLLQRFNNWIS